MDRIIPKWQGRHHACVSQLVSKFHFEKIHCDPQLGVGESWLQHNLTNAICIVQQWCAGTSWVTVLACLNGILGVSFNGIWESS